MIKKILSPLIVLASFSIQLKAQEFEKFVLTKAGIAPIHFTAEKISTEELYRGTLGWVNENLKKSGLRVKQNGKNEILLDSMKQQAFRMSTNNIMYLYDFEYTLQITIENNTITLLCQPLQIWLHPLSKKANFTIRDFFKTSGEVKQSYADAKVTLEATLNSIPTLLSNYLKTNLIPTLMENEFEKGYVKEGARYSVWRYFNAQKEVELVINHTTGKVMYLIPDTSAYPVNRNGIWTPTKLDIHPIPVTGFHNFYTSITNALEYPLAGCKPGEEGRVYFTFDIDTSGLISTADLLRGVRGSCDSTILNTIRSNKTKWIPGKVGRKKVAVRFAANVELRSEKDKPLAKAEDFTINPKAAKRLDRIEILNPAYDDKIYTFVEVSAEPVGGLESFYRWIGKTIRYPAEARRMGIEGKVFVKFTIEPNGSVSNVEIVKGFNDVCDKEAVRVISMSPKWKPGFIKGIPVRQTYTMPLTFKLSEGGTTRVGR